MSPSVRGPDSGPPLVGRDLLLASLEDERAAAYLYRALEETEPGRAGQLFGTLRAESNRQAGLWEERLRSESVQVPPFQPPLRLRVVAWLARRLGAARMLPVLSAMKVRGLSLYRGGAPAPADTASGEVPLPARVAEESWHRGGRSGGPLRASVFGVNDGLVSNASLILGMAGAEAGPHTVLLAGTAGLLAGGFSMAAGEYISVRTQREMLEKQIALERLELLAMPEEEVDEMTAIYRAKGLDADSARLIARRIVANPEEGLKTLAREELGLDPDSLASPAAAAAASFVSFAGGALVPLLPYAVGGGPGALRMTLALTALSLLGVGGSMSLFTGRGFWYSALRMLLIGALAGGATWALGRLFGVAAS